MTTINAINLSAAGVPFYNGSGTFTATAPTATAGQVLLSGASTTSTWSTPTYPSGSGSAGVILRSDGTNNVYSTATFANTYAVSTLLYAGSSNAVSGLSTANSAVLVTNSSGVPAWSGTLTNGQVIIGSTSGTPTAATLSAGTNISITNGGGSITIAASGADALTWSVVTASTQAMTTNSGYFANYAGALAFTLPTTSAVGDILVVNNINTAAGWSIALNSGQKIYIGSTSTTTTTGSLAATALGDSVTLVCSTANTTWRTTNFVGNITVV